jgi:hypothetical protein
MPYTLRVRVSTPEPPRAPVGKVALATSLDRAEIPEGERVELRAVLANVTGEALPLVTAILGLPAGLEARPDDLEALVAQGRFDAWELRGREIVLHLRSMAPGERRVIPLSLLAAIPGSFAGPASRAYLQYTDDEKHWTAPLHARVVALR